MIRVFRDALNAALQKLGFTWLTPHPTRTSQEIGYFQKAISKSDLYEMYKRNQLAYNIVFSVSLDAFNAVFVLQDHKGEVNTVLNERVHELYDSQIHLPLLKSKPFILFIIPHPPQVYSSNKASISGTLYVI